MRCLTPPSVFPSRPLFPIFRGACGGRSAASLAPTRGLRPHDGVTHSFRARRVVRRDRRGQTLRRHRPDGVVQGETFGCIHEPHSAPLSPSPRSGEERKDDEGGGHLGSGGADGAEGRQARGGEWVFGPREGIGVAGLVVRPRLSWRGHQPTVDPVTPQPPPTANDQRG